MSLLFVVGVSLLSMKALASEDEVDFTTQRLKRSAIFPAQQT
jgi:hypothetical protein